MDLNYFDTSHDLQVHVRPEGPFMWKPKVSSIK